MLSPTPMAQDEALRALAEIRFAIDRTARYSTFSALSGFIAGGAALAGSEDKECLNFCGSSPRAGV